MSNPIVPFDEQAVGDELRELVRKTTEEAIDAMSGEGADRLVGARPYERTNERAAYRAGHYERGFTTTSAGHAQDAETQEDEVRHRRHRALQEAREQREGGHHQMHLAGACFVSIPNADFMVGECSQLASSPR